MNQVEVLDTPIKSENDKRDYRAIKLPNGLKAILVHKSDEEDLAQKSEDIAAVKLSIHVGSFDDPPYVMGLAHFLEHLMFMGCEKYPGENSFIDFLDANGGYTNASTSGEKTNYEFKVSSKVFTEGLDRFASIFVSPLLLKEAMQREREAVDSEFKRALTNSEVLTQNVLKAFIKESHPSSQFDCGNLKTLKDNISDEDLHREVVSFFKKYAANRMCLAMHSKLSLDEMQALVVEKFSAIKAESEIPARSLTTNLEEIFKPEFFSKMIIMKPKNATKTLRLSWALPSVKKQYKIKPVKYLTKIFYNYGEGGLSSYLKDRQWITSLYLVSYQDGFGGSAEFCMPFLNINLTDVGAQNIGKILEAVFSYLLMIKETPIEEHRRLYTQFKDMMDLDFKFRREGSAMGTVDMLTETMFDCDDVDAIRGSELFQVYDENVIRSTIDMVNQRKFNLLFVNDEHQTFDKKEKFFGSEYQEIDFPEAYQKLWDERKPNEEFFLEKANPLTATNFEIFVDETESPKHPAKIVDDEIYEVWHKLDDKLKSPKVMIDIELMSPKVMSSFESYLYLEIYNDMLSKHFSKKLDQASNAGLSVSSQNQTRRLKLSFSGYNDKMNSAIEMTMKELKYFNEHMDQSTFDSMKIENKKSYYNRLLSYSGWNSELIYEVLDKLYYFDLSLYKGIDALSLENLQKFMMKFYAKLKIKVLVYGNYKKSDALKVVDILRESFECAPLDEPYELKERSFQVPIGTSILRAKSLMPNNENSMISTVFEIGKETLRTKNLTELLDTILHTRAFDYLRNKEQLGYSVGVSAMSNNGICMLKLHVQSQESKHSYAKVQQKMEHFMNEIAKKTIEELSDEEFESTRNSKLEKLVAAPSSLSEYYSRFWSEISSEEYIFDRTELKAKVLKSLKKADLQDFFKSFTEPQNMRKLNVQVIGSSEMDNNVSDKSEKELKIEFISEKLDEHENVITDIQDFKTKMNLHQIVRFLID